MRKTDFYRRCCLPACHRSDGRSEGGGGVGELMMKGAAWSSLLLLRWWWVVVDDDYPRRQNKEVIEVSRTGRRANDDRRGDGRGFGGRTRSVLTNSPEINACLLGFSFLFLSVSVSVCLSGPLFNNAVWATHTHTIQEISHSRLIRVQRWRDIKRDKKLKGETGNQNETTTRTFIFFLTCMGFDSKYLPRFGEKY